MNIAYASDDNFVDVMCVSIMSFNDHNSDATIYIMDCGIAEHNKQKILELCSGKNTVLFVDAKSSLEKLDYNLNLDRGSIASYARLFVGSMISPNVNKILYLDSDTLVRGCLKELYNTELQSYTIGGVRDSFSALNKKVFGIKKGELFINAGVLLIDLDKWRKQKIENRVYELLNRKSKMFQGDQGIINAVFHGNEMELQLKYDVMTYLYDFSYEEMMLYRKPDNYYSEEEIKKCIENPTIVHFSSSFGSSRPWNTIENNKHPFFGEWKYYFQKTGGKIIEEKKIRIKKGKSRALLYTIGILHAYLRPLKYLLN